MLLTIPYALEVVTKRTISLLRSDVKSRKSVGVRRRGMEETLKSHQHNGQGNDKQDKCHVACPASI